MANTERNKERQKDKVIVRQILKETCGNNLVIGALLPYTHSCSDVQCTISFSALLVGNIVGRGSFLLKKFMACLLDKVRSAVCCLRICLQLVPSHSLSILFSFPLTHSRSYTMCLSVALAHIWHLPFLWADWKLQKVGQQQQQQTQLERDLATWYFIWMQWPHLNPTSNCDVTARHARRREYPVRVTEKCLSMSLRLFFFWNWNRHKKLKICWIIRSY